MADNAPYHHAREVGTLSDLLKSELIDLMKDMGVEHIDLSLDQCWFELIVQPGVINDRHSIGINLDPSEQKQRTGKRIGKARVGTQDELRITFVIYLQQCYPEKIECMIKQYLIQEIGHPILWTPPYCPELQPIEMFWAVEKNYAAFWYKGGQKMKKTIQLLCEGWYGNQGTFTINHPFKREPIDCKNLWLDTLKKDGTKCVSYCEGISVTIGSLIIDKA